MHRRSLACRLALGAALFGLALRVGAPWLAAAAAEWRGVALGEVCEVYGVVLPGTAPHASGRHERHHHAEHAQHGSHSGADPGADPGGDHCGLTALGALATPSDAPKRVTDRSSARPPAITVANGSPLHDACAAWAARLEHGPPARA